MSQRIVICCDVDLAVPDGARTHTLDLVRAVAGLGHVVHLVARGPDPELAGVAYYPAVLDRVSTARRIWRFNATAIRVLIRNRRPRPVVYVRLDWASAPVVAVGRVLGRVVAVEVNDLPWGRGYPHQPGLRGSIANRVKPAVAALMCRAADRVVAITDALRSIVITDYRVDASRVITVPVGADVAAVTPRQRRAAQDRVGLDPTRRYAIFVGAFAPWVAFDTLLGGFAIVAHNTPTAALLLVGDGQRRVEVAALIDTLGIGDRVVTTGFIASRDDVLDYVAAANVCLLAHDTDRLGRTGASPAKLAEYIASGRAVVATELPGVADLVRGCGAGVVVPAHDTSAYAAALGAFLSDAETADRVGAVGRAALVRRYSWPVAAARIMASLAA